MVRVSCNAQAGSYQHVDAGQRNVGNSGTDPLGNLYTGGNVGIRQDHGEFLTSVAGPKVPSPKRAAEDGADSCQHLIAYGMTMLIVDLFEVVQVKEYQRKRRSCLRCLGEQALHRVGHGPFVRKPRKPIGRSANLGNRQISQVGQDGCCLVD